MKRKYRYILTGPQGNQSLPRIQNLEISNKAMSYSRVKGETSQSVSF